MNVHRRLSNASHSANIKRQAGVTLIETMISLALSMVVTSAMVVLMANSLGTATRIIQMSQLTDELRNAMSMMTRDVRRANYSANSAYCYANSECGTDGSANQFVDIDVTDGSCFIYGLDRDWDGDAATDDAGGFRRVTDPNNNSGKIEMWVGDSSPDCGADSTDWIVVTDPDLIDVTTFIVSDADSFSGSVTNKVNTVTQRTRQIQVQIEGQLILDNTITRRIEDKIKVRNDYISTSTI
jgi:type II secretory pathway pseudopilin PulG